MNSKPEMQNSKKVKLSILELDISNCEFTIEFIIRYDTEIL